MRIRVECYSGYKGNERPLRFYLDEHQYAVEEVLDQWYGPNDVYFRVRADDGNLYILRYTPAEGDEGWTMESFRSGRDATLSDAPE
jgi:hypothetical protein